MRLSIRAIVLFALVWIGLLMSGYGVLVGSSERCGAGFTVPLPDRTRHQHGAISPYQQRHNWLFRLSHFQKNRHRGG